MKRFHYITLVIALLAVTSATLVPQQVKAAIPRAFSEPIDLGEPVNLASMVDSTYGVENGHKIMYTVSFGKPAVFNVVDLETKQLLRSYPLPDTEDSWSHLTLPDGTVYVGTAPRGELFRYSPVTQQVESVGRFAGQRALYGLSYDELGNVYGGTYPGGRAFQFNVGTGEFRDYGQLVPLQEYVRSTAYYNGHLYAGIGTVGGIMKVNVETGEKTALTLPGFPGTTTYSTVGSMDVAGHYLFAIINGYMAIYDLDSGTWLEEMYDQARGLRLANGPEGSNNVYFIADNRLLEFDLNNERVTDTGVRYSTYLRGSTWMEVKVDSQLPGLSLATATYFGGIVYMNLETKTVKSESLPISGQPVTIRVIGKGPDGAIYMSGYPGGKGAKYDPATGQTTLFDLGQAEGMAAIGNKLYMGIYAGAVMIELDVTKSIDGANPQELFRIPGEDRPFGMTAGDGKLFIGTIPDYGQLGGALTVYDPTTEQHEIFNDVVYNQSIVSMVYKDGLLYGGTSVHGGEGIDPSENEAKMFVWDIATNQKVAEFSPVLPGALTAPKMISGLVFGSDGLLWAAADGIMFALNPKTFEVVKSKVVYDGVTNYGKWVPIYSYFGNDGLLYTTLAGHLTVIRTDTLEHIKLEDNVALLAVGDDGHLYYRSGSTHLSKIEVSDGVMMTDVYVSIPVSNPSFEETVIDGFIPGWAVGYQTELTSYEVSPEQSYSGQYSLKLVDTAQNPHTIAIRSDAFEVVRGTEYTAGAYIYLAEGRTLFSLDFYDAAKKQIGSAAAQITSNHGQWQYVEVTGTAPVGAVTAKIVPFVSQFWMATAFYDDVRLSYKLNPDMVDADWLKDIIRQYADAGELNAPLEAQLTNRVNQAEHHYVNGRTEQAIKHLDDFLKHLANPNRQVTDEAKHILESGAYYLQSNWSRP